MATGPGLGELGIKDVGVNVEFFAPKMYRYTASDKREVLTCKGVPSEYRATYMTNKEVEFAKAVGILEAAVRHLAPSEWVMTKRIMRETDPKREYYRVPGLTSGVYLSRPWDINALPS